MTHSIGIARITILCFTTFCILLLFHSPQADAEEQNQTTSNTGRPNIILIMADDIGYECFGCYGSKQYQTPNIDRLASSGLRFTHCYSQPLCTPSRVKLMSGLSNVRNYAAFSVLRRDQRTIGQYFQAADYQTCVAGKWQLLGAKHYAERFRQKGTWPREAGFDHFCLWQVDQLGSRYARPLLNVDGTNRQFGKGTYGPEVVTRYITDFMASSRKQDKPFFVYYPMILVHDPFVPTPDSKSPKSKDRQRNFEDMVAYMDKMVGRIVRQTEKLGIAEQTLILFTGDNGTKSWIHSALDGRTIQGGKYLTTDAGTRVPLVAYQPGQIPEGKTCDDLVDFSDFLPTLLQAARLNVPGGLDGRSFFPQLQGKPGRPRDWIYCYYCPRPERSGPVRFVRDKRWKLYASGRLYDVQNDPQEQHAIKSENQDSVAGAAKAREKLTAALQSMPAKGEALLEFPSAAP